MRRGTITILGILLAVGALGQQDAAFSQYFFNLLYINPAYAGTRDLFSGTLISRSQWMGTNGGPSTQSLSLHSSLPGNVGLGLQLYNDQAGPIKNTGLAATYAYRITVNEKTKISFGLSGSLSGITLNGNDIYIDNQADKAFSGNTSSSIVPDANAGVYLYKTRFYIGGSVTHLLQTKFMINETAGSDAAKYYRNYYLTSGFVFRINDLVNFRPSVLLQSVQSAPVVGELDGCFIFYDRLFVGVGLRTSKRINISGVDNVLVGIAELEFLSNFRIGYSYDSYLSQPAAYIGGAHEIMLGWDFSASKTKMDNPRFF